MSNAFIIAVALFFAGAGVSKLPNTGVAGGVMQIVAGAVIIIGMFV